MNHIIFANKIKRAKTNKVISEVISVLTVVKKPRKPRTKKEEPTA